MIEAGLAIVYGLTVLIPIHGAFWYGVRQERLKQRLMFQALIQRKR